MRLLIRRRVRHVARSSIEEEEGSRKLFSTRGKRSPFIGKIARRLRLSRSHRANKQKGKQDKTEDETVARARSRRLARELYFRFRA